jgi:parallel beta-helix repeat protein
MNGSVHGFAVGVLVADVRSNRIATVSLSTNLLFGILMTDSARSVVRDSSGNDNIPPEGDGMALFGSHDIRIVDNSFSRNGLGIHVEGSTNNLIEGNVISGNEGPGILMEADRNEIRSNKCRGNGICFILFSGNRNVIARNHVRGDASGISVENGHHNVVARNVVLRVRRTGIKLGIREPPIGGGRNVLRRNFVKGSGGDAFQVSKKDDNSVLSHNIARGAGDDGFGVQSDSARLTSNYAFGNADLGIQAVLGVIDGGGNIARSNGDPRQCVHIACD